MEFTTETQRARRPLRGQGLVRCCVLCYGRMIHGAAAPSTAADARRTPALLGSGSPSSEMLTYKAGRGAPVLEPPRRIGCSMVENACRRSPCGVHSASCFHSECACWLSIQLRRTPRRSSRSRHIWVRPARACGLRDQASVTAWCESSLSHQVRCQRPRLGGLFVEQDAELPPYVEVGRKAARAGGFDLDITVPGTRELTGLANEDGVTAIDVWAVAAGVPGCNQPDKTFVTGETFILTDLDLPIAGTDSERDGLPLAATALVMAIAGAMLLLAAAVASRRACGYWREPPHV